VSESPDIRGLQQTDRALRNLRRAALASVEIGTASYDVLPEVLEGAERDRVWREVVLVRALKS
jgi:hypothetical protein